MQLNYYLFAVGLLPELLAAKEMPSRRDVSCSYSVAPGDGESTCESLSQNWSLTLEKFKALNPDVQCPNLDVSKTYCVIGTVTEPTTTPTSTTLTTSTTTDSSHAPSPTMPGLAENCDKFHKVSSGDQCNMLEEQYNISHDQFMKWNSEINDECTNLWLNYYVCVHVPGAQPPPNNGPEPQMPGIVDNCKDYHKIVSGDNCYNMGQTYNFTLSEFLAWNTEVNDACGNLWADYYVCVGV